MGNKLSKEKEELFRGRERLSQWKNSLRKNCVREELSKEMDCLRGRSVSGEELSVKRTVSGCGNRHVIGCVNQYFACSLNKAPTIREPQCSTSVWQRTWISAEMIPQNGES